MAWLGVVDWLERHTPEAFPSERHMHQQRQARFLLQPVPVEGGALWGRQSWLHASVLHVVHCVCPLWKAIGIDFPIGSSHGFIGQAVWLVVPSPVFSTSSWRWLRGSCVPGLSSLQMPWGAA